MQLRPDQLATALSRGLRPLYTVYGDEPLLAQEAADAIRAAARAAGYAERKVFTVSGAHFDWSGLLGASQAMSLFADRQLIEIRIPGGKPGKDGSEALQRYCAQLSDDVLTLVQLPRLDRQQQGSGWFSALDAAGVMLRVDPVERRDLPSWIARRLAAQGQRVEDGDAGQRTLAFIADRVEGNLLAAHQELQKLALLYPAGVLGFGQVEAAVMNVARYDVFKLGEAVLAGQVGRALPQLADHQLAHLLEAAQVCDGIVKGLKHPGWPMDAWDAIKRLALMVMQPLNHPPAPPGRAPVLRRLALEA
jgi:DNA polymerase-3 subunit delta